ncbi:MAG: hypothetical protein DRJ30_02800 [Candidatus Methanomethylicota archaeon]|nr:MAG: hypothetical protein DRJ30_02800 [Candidatus Verstraetearchaeota archaeon]
MKFEVRVAGLSYFKPIIICCIFRGGLWLDGVISNICADNPFHFSIHLLADSCHFPQIGCIIFDGLQWEKFKVDLDLAFKILKKPVIIISDHHDASLTYHERYNYYFDFRGFSKSEVLSLLDRITIFKGVVEPVRISRLLALNLLTTLSS